MTHQHTFKIPFTTQYTASQAPPSHLESGTICHLNPDILSNSSPDEFKELTHWVFYIYIYINLGILPLCTEL